MKKNRIDVKKNSLKAKNIIADKKSPIKKLKTKKHATPIEKVKQFVKQKMKNNKKQKHVDEHNDNDQSQKNNATTTSSKSEALMTFFYTNDKFITQFEDDEIVSDIQQKFPLFMMNDVSDTMLKKTICQMILDKDFIDSLLLKYDMTILDFFKFIFRLDISIFKGSFMSKLYRLLNQAGYKVKLRK